MHTCTPPREKLEGVKMIMEKEGEKNVVTKAERRKKNTDDGGVACTRDVEELVVVVLGNRGQVCY